VIDPDINIRSKPASLDTDPQTGTLGILREHVRRLATETA
jgi:hypothetical protein